MIYTPDHDLYLERVSCKGSTARMGLPRNLRARAYRFREAITNDVIKKFFRDSVKLARQKGFEVHVPSMIYDESGTAVPLDSLFGDEFADLAGKGGHAGVQSGTPKHAQTVRPAHGDWL